MLIDSEANSEQKPCPIGWVKGNVSGDTCFYGLQSNRTFNWYEAVGNCINLHEDSELLTYKENLIFWAEVAFIATLFTKAPNLLWMKQEGERFFHLSS